MPSKPRTAPKSAQKVAKKGAVASGSLNKSDFIRSMPLTMAPSKVVDEAAKAGITINNGFVYSVRLQDVRRHAKAAGTPLPPRARGRSPRGAAPVQATTLAMAARAPVPSATAASVSAAVGRERKLVQLALDIGLARSVELIGEIRSKLVALL